MNTMGRILESWRTILATVFAVAFIAGAFFLARGVEPTSSVQASTESDLLSAIATKDSDGDGLPDWEEALYGTDSRTTDTLKLGMTDGEAVAKGLIVPKALADISGVSPFPLVKSDIDYAALGIPAPSEGTLTDTFAKNFFTFYVEAKAAGSGADLSADQMQAVENKAINSLSSTVAPSPDFKSIKSLFVLGTGVDALKAFAVGAEAILKKNTSTATTSELIYLQYAVDNNDTAALSNLSSIAKAYRDTAVGLSVLSVPTELAAADLALVNSLMRVGEIINDFAHVNTDPLTAMLALQQYVPAARALGQAYADIGEVYSASGVTIQKGKPGADFIRFVAGMKTKQQVLNTP